ncbi:hypothetical protein SAMN02745866_03586 [Alteromonadaceae bacterium Bs31]|nr:hypothetical protein SAMN02745866_03586 [Alteromonadaceae bacterium Bs31]
MAEKSYIHKKRIVFTALYPYFFGEKLMRAMVIWDQKYSHSPSTAVQHFVYDLKNSVDPNADIRGAHLNLIRAASLPEAELMNDPSGKMEDYLKKYNLSESAEFSMPEYQTLQKFINTWQRHLGKKDSQLVTLYVIENISKQKINQALSLFFVSWISKKENTLQVPNADVRDLRKIINLFYTGCCEYVGPVKTDEILSKVVQAFKQLGGDQHRILIEQLL